VHLLVISVFVPNNLRILSATMYSGSTAEVFAAIRSRKCRNKAAFLDFCSPPTTAALRFSIFLPHLYDWRKFFLEMQRPRELTCLSTTTNYQYFERHVTMTA
jgi:hypothetical protein